MVGKKPKSVIKNKSAIFLSRSFFLVRIISERYRNKERRPRPKFKLVTARAISFSQGNPKSVSTSQPLMPENL